MTKKNVKRTTKASSATAPTPSVEPVTWTRGDGVVFDLTNCSQTFDVVTKRWMLSLGQADVAARKEKWPHAQELPSA